jgi:malonyl-CoA decarboxylase
MTWGSPAVQLEKLIQYEAVHEIRSWADLQSRLDSDRRCFAFFHSGMPEAPLIFVEVALVEEMIADIHTLLHEGAPAVDPESTDTAIFYSISNAQQGLAGGGSFGRFLIEDVVDDLAWALPAIKTFATLSLLPGFRSWLEGPVWAEMSDLAEPADAKALAMLSGEETRSLALSPPRSPRAAP